MKSYVNKTRFMKRIVFIKGGKSVTQFLTSGQRVLTNDQAEFVDQGVKVTVVEDKPKRTSNKANNEETNTTDTGKE